MYKVIKSFKFAYQGIYIKEFSVGAEIEDGDDCLAVAKAEKWVEEMKDSIPPPPPTPQARSVKGEAKKKNKSKRRK